MNAEAKKLRAFIKWGHVPSLWVGIEKTKKLDEILRDSNKLLSKGQRRRIDRLMGKIISRDFRSDTMEFKKKEMKRLLTILNMSRRELYRRIVDSIL